MVKASLTGKRQTTTQALGAGIARWIMQAGCGVMVLIGGELVPASIIESQGVLWVELVDSGLTFNQQYELTCVKARIYRDTVRQIKSMIGLA